MRHTRQAQSSVELKSQIVDAAHALVVFGQIMSEKKTPARYIRENVFKCDTQEKFAQILDVDQATVSRWETGKRRLDRTAQEKIRAVAKERGIKWDNNWFFEVPIPHPKRGRVKAAKPMVALNAEAA